MELLNDKELMELPTLVSECCGTDVTDEHEWYGEPAGRCAKCYELTLLAEEF